MPLRGFYKVRAPGSLKEAVAQLVLACGGQRRAAELCRVSSPTLAQYTDDSGDNETRHMPVDVVAALEQSVGDPIVTRFLASHASCALVDLSPSTLARPYPLRLADIGKETGEFFAEAAKDIADGKLDEKEAGRVRREALQMAAALMALVGDIDRMAASR
jgi:hypothetical protein